MNEATVKDAVTASIAALIGRASDTIEETDDLASDLGVDSLIAIKLLHSVESKLGRSLPEGSEGSLVGISTVRELVQRLTAIFALAEHQGSPSTSDHARQ